MAAFLRLIPLFGSLRFLVFSCVLLCFCSLGVGSDHGAGCSDRVPMDGVQVYPPLSTMFQQAFSSGFRYTGQREKKKEYHYARRTAPGVQRIEHRRPEVLRPPTS
ncbi:hypothetical protein P170DRAFT_441326 [Aspergillus steynii IBT 23096]|uniref:Secreted protein n=1 Tax=Aspergillus steynii IBT 23096 TaxID=1392250 RepID=A0A2I2FTF1_9EURO|nr:uncharacterized protein P170DRAFT_441326 [Aspergillus steynii IBT 23096]PLB43881.1 hypothetical protein P170DRAFT_441326 [Aspergillus steynii IBT 23096]